MTGGTGRAGPADVEARVVACTDADQLTEWIGRAATAGTLDEVFA